MEDFSQSRGEDDLFDDEIVPIEATQQVDAVASHVEEASLNTAPVAPRGQVAEAAPASRGRGKSGPPRGGPKNGLLGSRFAPSTPQEVTPQPEAPTGTQDTQEDPAPPTEDASLANTTSNTTSNPQPTPSKPAAVRGDRTGTGGVKKPKLTDEELNAKLAAAKERSQNLSAAHARAQADAASFEQRERVAQEKRAKDVANRKVMDNEREKNRARKMAVMGGREWDAEKNEEDFRIHRGGRGRGSDRMRAMNGTTSYDRRDPAMDDTRQYEWHEDRGRGRGNRGRGRGGRGGRGDARNSERQPDIRADTEFPALPATGKPKEETPTPTPTRPPPARTESDLLSPSGERGTWADQVESEAAKD